MAIDSVRSASHMGGRFSQDAWRFVEVFGVWLREHRRRILFWTGGILIGFAVLGFLVAPALIKPALERKLSAALDRNVSIARLDINPFAGSATLDDVSISERGEGPPMLTVSKLYVNGEVASLFRWAPVISA